MIYEINWNIKRKTPLKDETLRSAFPYKYSYIIAKNAFKSQRLLKWLKYLRISCSLLAIQPASACLRY